MSTTHSDPKRIPAILVGIGGTGILALRFLKTLARYGEEAALKQDLENKRLQLVGIDTDAGSNRLGRAIEENMEPRELGDLDAALPFTELEPLDDFVRIDAGDISRALLAVRLSVQRVKDTNEQDCADPIKHVEIARWFPPPTDSGDEISYGQSRQAGAAQWRALGRLGLFLHADEIYERLHAAHEHVRGSVINDTELDGIPPRAYVIGSLAGGTGSGMFWDVGYMLRTFNPDLIINGVFLLPDVFDELDKARRILPNAYAALKELAHLKNWTWKKQYRFDWPGCPEKFTAYRGGKTAYDAIYLHRGHAPNPKSADYAKARIDLTCLRMAQNLLGQLRVDVHTEMDQGANNESGDVTAHYSDPVAGFVFASSGTTQFQAQSLKKIHSAIWKCVLHYLYRTLDTSDGDLVHADSIDGIMGFEIGKADAVYGELCRYIAGQLPERSPRIREWIDAMGEKAEWEKERVAIEKVLSFEESSSEKNKEKPSHKKPRKDHYAMAGHH